MRDLRLLALLFLLVGMVSGPGNADAQWQEFNAADGSYSFSMPQKPEENERQAEGYGFPSHTLFYVTNTREIRFIFAGRTKYHADAKVPVRSELEANANNFAKAMKGKLSAERFFTWTLDGRSYDAFESFAESQGGRFRQLYIIDGNVVYAVIAGPETDNNKAAIGRFISSLRLRKP
jgi:hypothetical protein